MLEVSVERLAERADRIVRGTVARRTVTLSPGARAIWTTYHLRVSETLAGVPTGSLDVHVPGGRVGDLEQEIHGVARLDVGQETVLFLWTDSQGRHRVLGQAQGAFRVRKNADSGEPVCTNAVDGLILVNAEGSKQPGRVTRLALATLRKRIATARQRAAERRRVEAEARARRRENARKRAERTRRATHGRPGTAE